MKAHPSRRDWLRSAALALPASALGVSACRSAETPTQGAQSVPAQRDVRSVAFVMDAAPTMEGAGVRLRRSIGSRALSLLDPFLLLDEIHSDRVEDYVKGFPTHPHRGFETVTYIAPTLLDLRLPSSGHFEHELPRDHTVFAYVLEGTAELGASLQAVTAGQIAVFTPGQVVAARSAQSARLLVVAGRKIGEPVARRGPFVMNTNAELEQAFEDYQNGTLVSG